MPFIEVSQNVREALEDLFLDGPDPADLTCRQTVALTGLGEAIGMTNSAADWLMEHRRNVNCTDECDVALSEICDDDCQDHASHHLCDDECGDPEHPRDGRLAPAS